MALSVSLLAILAAITLYAIRSLSILLRRQRMIRQHGCQPIVKFPSGREYDRIVKQSIQEGTFNPTAMSLYERCGTNTYEVHSVNERVVNTMEPLNHMTIATKTDDWKKDVRRGARPLLGTNILDQDAAAWKQTRDLVVPLFKRAELREVDNFRKFVDRFIDKIPSNGDTIDLQPLIRKLFLDSSTGFIFGESIDSLRDTTGKSENFIATFNRAVKGAGTRIRPTGYKLLYNNIFGAFDKEWLADCKVVHDYVDGCIARHRSRAKELSGERQRYVLIDGMSAAIQNSVDLRFQLLGIFSIARETGAMAFSSVMFMLARNSHVWTELRQEALKLGDGISFEQLNNLSSFRNTVMEAFRLHSPITRVRRRSARDTILPLGGGSDGLSPCFIPAGITIWADRYPKTRDPAIWGEDVEAFRPSRFEGRHFGWEFQPFSGGPRVCPARDQVVLQCMYLLFRLVRKFERIENRDLCEEYVEGLLMAIESRNGCKVALFAA